MKYFSLLLLGGLLLLGSGCVTDDDMPVPADRLTTVELILRQPPATQLVFRWIDNDGPGGNMPAADIVTLPPNNSYTYVLRLLDQADVLAQVDRTSEIRFAGTDYLVCALAAGTAIDSLAATDEDANGDPLGLEGTLRTGSAGAAQMRILVLRDPDKSVPSRCGTGTAILDASLLIDVQ